MTKPALYIARDPNSPKRWAILHRETGRVVEGGFSSQDGAYHYLALEYNAETGAAK